MNAPELFTRGESLVYEAGKAAATAQHYTHVDNVKRQEQHHSYNNKYDINKQFHYDIIFVIHNFSNNALKSSLNPATVVEALSDCIGIFLLIKIHSGTSALVTK